MSLSHPFPDMVIFTFVDLVWNEAELPLRPQPMIESREQWSW